jgi:threonine aldolase
MAWELGKRLQEIKGLTITQKVESNGVFIIIPPDVAEQISKEYFFYSWNEQMSEYRLMTSWDTTSDDVNQFADRLTVMMSERK